MSGIGRVLAYCALVLSSGTRCRVLSTLKGRVAFAGSCMFLGVFVVLSVIFHCPVCSHHEHLEGLCVNFVIPNAVAIGTVYYIAKFELRRYSRVTFSP